MNNRFVARGVLVGLVFLLAIGGGMTVAQAADDPLPQREGARPQTTAGMPHVQIGVTSVPAVDAALLRRVATLPGVDVRPTVISLPGAKGFWIEEHVAVAQPQAIVGGREFAHVHPDGSLHAALASARAREAIQAGWAVAHPWANKRAGWEGFVMLYTPQSMAELEVTFQLVVDGYNYVTGQAVRAADHAADR